MPLGFWPSRHPPRLASKVVKPAPATIALLLLATGVGSGAGWLGPATQAERRVPERAADTTVTHRMVRGLSMNGTPWCRMGVRDDLAGCSQRLQKSRHAGSVHGPGAFSVRAPC